MIKYRHYPNENGLRLSYHKHILSFYTYVYQFIDLWTSKKYLFILKIKKKKKI